MSLNNKPRQFQVRKSDTYDDTLAPGSTLETTPIDIEGDINALRSQVNRILDATGIGNWYDDIPLVDSAQKGLKQIAIDLASLTGNQSTVDTFVPTLGQTVFTLSQIPTNPNTPIVILNTATLLVGLSFNISGSTLTITLPYQLSNTDHLYVIYDYST